MLTFSFDSCQHALSEYALLARFRLLLADLENSSDGNSSAAILQVRQQESKAGEQGMFRKTGASAAWRKAAGQHQPARPVFGQSGCSMPGSRSGVDGELTRPHSPA